MSTLLHRTWTFTYAIRLVLWSKSADQTRSSESSPSYLRTRTTSCDHANAIAARVTRQALNVYMADRNNCRNLARSIPLS